MGQQTEPSERDALVAFWDSKSRQAKRLVLRVEKRALFERIRSMYCSRCYGLFGQHYEMLRSVSAGKDTGESCKVCMDYYTGLSVTDNGAVTLEDSRFGNPLSLFDEANQRERERQLQFISGGICGSGFEKKPGVTMCALHTSPVPTEALTEYWSGLPEEHRGMLFQLREEDFCAELDANLRYQLRICRECRGNVIKSYRELKLKAAEGKRTNCLEICDGTTLTVADGLVTISGDAVWPLFERAEEVEDCKALDPDLDDDYDNSDRIRHAETPELAREALIDSAALIFKSQVEVAFREQTAGHNALLLFVHLALRLMEERLRNAFKELQAKQSEVELLEMVAREQERKEAKKAKKRSKKGKNGCTAGAGEAEPAASCHKCAALQLVSETPRSPSPVASSPPRSRPSGTPAGRAPLNEDDVGWEVQTAKRRGSLSQPLDTTASRPASPSPSATSHAHTHAIPAVHQHGPAGQAHGRHAPAARTQPGKAETAAPAGRGHKPEVRAIPIAVPQREAPAAVIKPISPPADAQHAANMQQAGHWTPWTGRTSALQAPAPLVARATPQRALGAIGQPLRQPVAASAVFWPFGDQAPIVYKVQGEREATDAPHDPFSLFHHSPVARPRGLPRAHDPLLLGKDDLSTYSLFGGSGAAAHPLASLAAIVTQ